MDKLKLAHDYAIALINSDCEMQFDKFIQLCWNYADAMQAEADKREDKMRPDVLKEEWQPDWSQAPEWSNSWGMAEIGQAWWLSGEWHVNNRGGFSSTGFIKAEKAPSFDYQGNWQDSLRKRPQ